MYIYVCMCNMRCLQSSLGVTSAQFVHILSHCPYLLAQCCRYKGRDLHATVHPIPLHIYTYIHTYMWSHNVATIPIRSWHCWSSKETAPLIQTVDFAVIEYRVSRILYLHMFERLFVYAYVCMYVYVVGNAISKDAKAQLLASILRFPSMLAAPPERLLG